MLKIYFDDVLIDEDSYTALNDDYQLFTDSFKLGSTASNSFKLSVNKSMVSNQPIEVKIEDDNTTFYLVVDSIAEDKYTYTYTLTDKLLNFNFKYDASEIINAKAELEETCYLSDIWHDMCDKADVEYDDTYTFLNDIEVTWYDNTIQARKYLSYIAELQSGYACILPNGKQSFKPHKKASSKTISIDECSDFILGEKKTITRVVYDVGTIKWEFGDETGATVYLDTTNVFITNEDIVEAIYDGIVGFEFYLVDVPNAPMDSDIRAGDVITFTDGTNNYPTIAQYSMSYSGDWVGSFSLKITTNKQQETNVVGTKESISKIQSDINRIDGTLTITAEKTDENTSLISSLTVASDSITETVSQLSTVTNNNYQEITGKLGNYALGSDVATIQESVTSIQTSTYTKTDINKIVTGEGVDGVVVTKVSTTSGTFDEDGLTIDKTDSPTTGQFNEIGVRVIDKTGSVEKDLLFAGYDETIQQTIVRADNFAVKNKLTIGSNARCEDYRDSDTDEWGTGVFDI